MKNKHIVRLLIPLLLIFAIGTTAMASNLETVAAVPVTLTVSNRYRAVSVSVPAALPVEVIDGEVFAADSAKIKNNSTTGAIQVTEVSVIGGAYKIGSFNDFNGTKTIALEINGCETVNEGMLKISDESFPVIKAEGSLPLLYSAKVSADAPNGTDVEAAHVVFTISVTE